MRKGGNCGNLPSKSFINDKKVSLQSVAWDLYTTPATKITKRYELVTITWGTIWEEQNSESKSQQIAAENS